MNPLLFWLQCNWKIANAFKKKTNGTACYEKIPGGTLSFRKKRNSGVVKDIRFYGTYG